MKKLLLLLLLVFSFLIGFSAEARSYKTKSSDVYVKGYYRADGTYVQGYYRSAPDSSKSNNYSCIDYGKDCGYSSSLSEEWKKKEQEYRMKILSGEEFSQYYNDGVNLYNNRYYEDALNSFKKAIETDSNNIYVNKAKSAYIQISLEIGNKNLESGNYSDTVKYYKLALVYEEDRAMKFLINYSIAYCYYSLKDIVNANEYIKEASRHIDSNEEQTKLNKLKQDVNNININQNTNQNIKVENQIETKIENKKTINTAEINSKADKIMSIIKSNFSRYSRSTKINYYNQLLTILGNYNFVGLEQQSLINQLKELIKIEIKTLQGTSEDLGDLLLDMLSGK